MEGKAESEGFSEGCCAEPPDLLQSTVFPKDPAGKSAAFDYTATIKLLFLSSKFFPFLF